MGTGRSACELRVLVRRSLKRNKSLVTPLSVIFGTIPLGQNVPRCLFSSVLTSAIPFGVLINPIWNAKLDCYIISQKLYEALRQMGEPFMGLPFNALNSSHWNWTELLSTGTNKKLEPGQSLKTLNLHHLSHFKPNGWMSRFTLGYFWIQLKYPQGCIRRFSKVTVFVAFSSPQLKYLLGIVSSPLLYNR